MPEHLEQWLQQHAVYDPRSPKTAPMQEIWTEYAFEELTRGLQTRVFRMKDQPWVIKEGRWDLDFNLFGNVKMPLPAKLTEDIWKQFSQTFLPTEEEILRQYGFYLEFAEYLGFFGSKDIDVYHHPELQKLVTAQHQIRDSLVDSLESIEDHFDFTMPEVVKEILEESSIRHHNFLPKEYLLMGPALSKENQNRDTYFVFQEFIQGDHLHDVNLHQLLIREKHQMILLLLLLLLLHQEKHLLPDMRPRYLVLEIHNWLTRTDNIILGKQGLKFIDTRWFWQTDSNFVKRGLIVPEVMLVHAKNLLVELCESL